MNAMKPARLLAVAVTLLLLAACSGKTVRREVVIGRETMNVIMPTGSSIEHPVHGREVWFAIGPMHGQAPVAANGMTQSHVFADGTSLATVTLNIEEAPKNSRYVAWLRKPGSFERVRLDAMQNPMRDVRHAVTVEIDTDVRAYTEAVVTLEWNAGPSDSDPVVAIGAMKQRKR